MQYFIENSTAIVPEIDEKIDTQCYYINLLKQPQKSKPVRGHLLPILESDFSSISPSPRFEIRDETYLTEDNVSLSLKRLASDPSFRIPSECAGGFRPVKPIQGKGIAASKLLVESRR